MKTLDEIKKTLLDQKPFLRERYGVTEIGVFGSYVRSEEASESDVDILVDFGQPPQVDLLDLVNMESYLTDILGIKVDVAVKSSLRKRIGNRILQEVVQI